MLFDERIIIFDQVAADNKAALSVLADKLHQSGCVTEEYKHALLRREEQYPTGLQGISLGVAIPHTDADKVIKPQIGFMRLKTPVRFLQIGDNSEVQVSLIFMLALNKSGDQLSTLQLLMGLFQNKSALDALQTVNTTDDFLGVMRDAGIIEHTFGQ